MSEQGVPLYDRFGREYDVMVSWPERLRREWPFLEARFRAAQARRVLDVGTGTGVHAIWFAQHGYQAVGTDPSPEMLRQARLNAGDTSGVWFTQASLGEQASVVGGRFDAVTCLGNTLPHALTEAELLVALRDLRSVLKSDGVLVVQLLNYDRILATGERFLGLSAGQEGPDEVLFFRFYDYPQSLESGCTLTFNVAIMRRTGSDWRWRVESTRLLPVRSDQLLRLLPAAGFGAITLFGGYAEEPFEPDRSNDLIVVARAEGA